MPDLSGHKFGRWLVLHKDLDRLDHKGIKSYYICQCDCGSIHSVSAYGLRNGTSKSCGCKTKDRITKYNYRHGLSRTDIYRIFRCMKERCYSPKHSSYKNYGGRGIGICEEWKNNPESFVNWALNSGYQKGLTIDRKNGLPEKSRLETELILYIYILMAIGILFLNFAKSIILVMEPHGRTLGEIIEMKNY